MKIKEHILCNGIIHSASAVNAVVGAGLAQLPVSDHLIIGPVQVGMAVSLGRVFGIQLSHSAATAECARIVATTVGRAASQLVCGWIPGYGNVVNASTAASITELLGWELVREFEHAKNEETI